MHVIGINLNSADRIYLESLWNRLNHGPSFPALNEMLRKQTTNTRNQKSDSKRFENTSRERIFLLPHDKVLAHILAAVLILVLIFVLILILILILIHILILRSPGRRCAFAAWNLKRANLLYVFIAFNLDTIKATKRKTSNLKLIALQISTERKEASSLILLLTHTSYRCMYMVVVYTYTMEVSYCFACCCSTSLSFVCYEFVLCLYRCLLISTFCVLIFWPDSSFSCSC